MKNIVSAVCLKSYHNMQKPLCCVKLQVKSLKSDFYFIFFNCVVSDGYCHRCQFLAFYGVFPFVLLPKGQLIKKALIFPTRFFPCGLPTKTTLWRSLPKSTIFDLHKPYIHRNIKKKKQNKLHLNIPSNFPRIVVLFSYDINNVTCTVEERFFNFLD